MAGPVYNRTASNFAELVEAIAASVDGETIGLAGNTFTFTSDLVVNKSITIRRSSGYSPVFDIKEFQVLYTNVAVSVAHTLTGPIAITTTTPLVGTGHMFQVMNLAGGGSITLVGTDLTIGDRKIASLDAVNVFQYGVGDIAVTLNNCEAHDITNDAFAARTAIPAPVGDCTLILNDCTAVTGMGTGATSNPVTAHTGSTIQVNGGQYANGGGAVLGYSSVNITTPIEVVGATLTAAGGALVTVGAGAVINLRDCDVHITTTTTAPAMLAAASGSGQVTFYDCTVTVGDGVRQLVAIAGTASVSCTFWDCTFAIGNLNPAVAEHTFRQAAAAGSFKMYRCYIDASSWITSSFAVSLILGYGPGEIVGNTILAPLVTTVAGMSVINANSAAMSVRHNTVYHGGVVAVIHYGIFLAGLSEVRGNIVGPGFWCGIGANPATYYDDVATSDYNLVFGNTYNISLGTPKAHDIVNASDIYAEYADAPDDLRRATDAPGTFVVPEADYQIAYDLATTIVPAGHGSITRDPAWTAYEKEPIAFGAAGLDMGAYANVASKIELTAVPIAPYTFFEWQGSLTGDVNPQEVTMSEDRSVIATFVEQEETPGVRGAGLRATGLRTEALRGAAI